MDHEAGTPGDPMSAAYADRLRLAELHHLAVEIADATCRADIEMNARRVYDADGHPAYNTLLAEAGESDMPAVVRAVAYIEMRGNAFPWKFRRHLDSPHVVQFLE